MTAMELIKKDAEWHAAHPDLAPNPEFAAGFVAGLRHALDLVGRFPDWEEVCEHLMDVVTIQDGVIDSLPAGIEDMITPEEVERVAQAYAAYNAAHKSVNEPSDS